MDDVYKFTLTPTSCRWKNYSFIKDYKYRYYIMNLKKAYYGQIDKDLRKKVYDMKMLDRIIESGQLDDFGCLTVEGMKAMRHYKYNDHGFDILN